jgi:glycerophosphoryl diester phosphodiesterase
MQVFLRGKTDISFTKDGVPVLLHNSSINEMARNEDGSELTFVSGKL